MGDKFRTIQNLEIIKSDMENNLIFIKGSVPGSKNSFVLIQKNKKNINRTTTAQKVAKTKSETSVSQKESKKDLKKPEAKKTEPTKKTEPQKKEVKK